MLCAEIVEREDKALKIGFDNDKYLKMQSEHIRERIAQFGNKLYLEFGGKLFDDYHASRVLPGFKPDSKLQMLLQLKDQAEIVIVISAEDIEKNKIRGDYGITYDVDVLRLIDAFQGVGLYVGSVCITKFAGQPNAERFQQRLAELGIKSYRHYKIPGYPSDVTRIVSDEGYGKNEYIETTRPLVVITAPGPGSGKMATCLSQLYHEHKKGIEAGYAKFETFPIWNLPLKHPVNLAYEAATADLNDVNMIDPFHLEAYGQTTVNYNRDIEIFPVVDAMFKLLLEWIIGVDLLQPIFPLLQNGMTTAAMVLLFSNIERERDFYTRVVKLEGPVTFHDIAQRGVKKLLLELIEERMTGKTPKHEWLTPDVVAAYYAQSMCFITESWVRQGMPYGPQEMADAYQYMITRSMEDIINEL